jgi:hypothetical protein
LLRDGRPGVQALVELDVYSAVSVESSEMPSMENQYYQVREDCSEEDFESPRFRSQSSDQQFSLIGEKLRTVGKLVMRIGNVGSVGSAQPSIESLKSNRSSLSLS